MTIMKMKRMIMSLVAATVIAVAANAKETPTYPGGEEAMKKFIAENLQYPASAIENEVEGVVTVSFTVAPDGTLSNFKIVRMIDPDLEKEAVRIVKKMPAWIPADKDGTPVEAPAKVRIEFNL